MVARHKNEMKGRSYMTVGDEKILWSEVDLKTGETKIFITPEQAEEYEARIMGNIGRNMSRYMENHPESALWGETN